MKICSIVKFEISKFHQMFNEKELDGENDGLVDEVTLALPQRRPHVRGHLHAVAADPPLAFTNKSTK